MNKQIPWKFLPIVILLLFLPAIPVIFMRHETRQAAQAAVVNETELRALIVDSLDDTLGQQEATCVANKLISFHGAQKVADLYRAGDANGLYGPVAANMKITCGVEWHPTNE